MNLDDLDAFTDEDAMAPACDETRKYLDQLCQSIQSAWLVFLGYAFFCLLAFSQPDEVTLKKAAKITMPFAAVEINFFWFWFIAPIVLLLILSYLHILLEQWHRYKSKAFNDRSRSTFIFNMESPAARLMSNFTFYALGPLTLMFLDVKLRAWPENWLLIFGGFTIIVILILAFLFARRRRDVRFAVLGALALAAIAVLLVGWASFSHRMAYCAPLRLADSDLSETDLKTYYLENVAASGARFKGADFGGLQLRHADFSFAHLEGADFTSAKLETADFNHALLSRGDFSEADLRGANFRRADLEQADFSNAHLEGVTFVRANLTRADLTGRNLSGVDFPHVQLVGAQLSRADLSYATFLRTDLRSADLTGAHLDGAIFFRANLTGADIENGTFKGARFFISDLSYLKDRQRRQLREACGDKRTTPPHLVYSCAGPRVPIQLPQVPHPFASLPPIDSCWDRTVVQPARAAWGWLIGQGHGETLTGHVDSKLGMVSDQ